MSRLSSVVKRHPPLCAAWAEVAVPGRDHAETFRGRVDDDDDARTETGRGKKGVAPAIALGKVNLLLALLGCSSSSVQPAHLPCRGACPAGSHRLTLTVLSAWRARPADSSMGSFAIPSAVNCGPICCRASASGCFWALFGSAILRARSQLLPAGVALVLWLPLPDRIPYPPLVTRSAPRRS